MNIFQKITLFLLSLFVLLTAVPAFAEGLISTPSLYVSDTPSTCVNLTYTLRIGDRDVSSTNGPSSAKTMAGTEVTLLQNFLHTKGYLSVPATGYFGPLTLRAVKAFQSASASGAIDGIVGVQTRAHITAATCTMNTPVIPSQTPSITNITPTAGATGTTVTITGTNFTPTGNIVHLAVGGIGNISSFVIPSTDSNISPHASAGPALEQLSFTVPSSIGAYCKPDQACPMFAMLLKPGTYPVSVENTNGTSASVSFTITDN